MCDSLSEAGGVLDFRSESERGAFVDDCAKTIFYCVISIDGSRVEIPEMVFEKPL